MPLDEDLQRGLGRAVKARRREMDLTQEAFGRRCGLSKTAISRLENGRSDPSWSKVCRVAEALEMKVSFLAAEAEDQQRLLESERENAS